MGDVAVPPSASQRVSYAWVAVGAARVLRLQARRFHDLGPDEPLENGIVFCAVRSWITGQRLVSLPFSDHCEPLTSSPAEHVEILAHVCGQVGPAPFKYVEIRPLSVADAEELAAVHLAQSKQLCLHVLSLDPSAEELFRGLHKNCIQRKVRRAEKEGLGCQRDAPRPCCATSTIS